MALRDYFAESSHAALVLVRGSISNQHSGLMDQELEEISAIARRIEPKDLWALQYITLFRVQPLIEALDDDGSSFVTIAEVNAFTTAQPGHWR